MVRSIPWVIIPPATSSLVYNPQAEDQRTSLRVEVAQETDNEKMG